MSDLIKTYINAGKWYEINGNDELWEDIDFTEPRNFCRFGSAEEYYKKTVENTLESFPYDGSWKQKNEWYSNLFMLDRYFYKNILPKTTGYIEFSATGWGARAAVGGGVGEPVNKEYIKLSGGPNNPDGTFDGSNILNSSELRGSNLSFGDKNTIEFFMKRGANDFANTTSQECILDIWNQVAYTDAAYRRLSVYVETTTAFFVEHYFLKIRLTCGASSTEVYYETSYVKDNLWHFYSISVENIGSDNVEFKIYIDGQFVSSAVGNVVGIGLTEVNLVGFVGAYQGAFNIANAALLPGFGKLEACLDELRFFKTIRSAEDIQTYYRCQIFGGTNDDDENEGLGFYYKFNEGIYGHDNYDAQVTDYSGRKTNGYWYGYVGGRSEDSAFEESGACDIEESDLVLNLQDSRVLAVYNTYSSVGRSFDISNRYSIKRSLPNALVSAIDNDDFTAFCQVIGAFFDEMLLIQSNIPKNLIGRYEFTGLVNNDINLKHLNSLGLKIDDLFGYADWRELLLGVNSSNSLEGTVDNVKKIILSNLTNEAMSLLKSKGTTESIKKALRCFGIAEDVVKVKKYSAAEKLEDDKTIRSPKFYRKRYADFINEDNHGCVVSNVLGVELSTDRHFLRIPADGTFEEVNHCFYCDIIVPTEAQTDTNTSIFGMMQVNADDETAIGITRDLYANIKKFPAYGKLAGEIKVGIPAIGWNGNLLIDAPIVDFFTGDRWAIVVQVYSEELKYSLSGVPASDYTAKISLFRVKDSVCELAYETSQAGFVPADIDTLFATAKRFYLGAYRENIKGALQLNSECKIGDFRYYAKYFTDDEIIRLVEEKGVLGCGNFTHEDLHTEVAVQDSMFLNWNFDNVDTLVVDGAAYKTEYIADCADGTDLGAVTTDVGAALSYRYPCTGYLVPSDDLGSFFVDEYVLGFSEDEVENNFDGDVQYNIKNYDFEKFFKNNVKGIELYSVEKSFANVLDGEISQIFSDKNEYYDLFLDGSQRYKDEYDVLAFAKQLYFRKIESGYLDFDKFYNYYKWIDGAVSEFLSQLVSLKKHSNNAIINTVEHHMLERSKIHYKREQDVILNKCSYESDAIISSEIIGSIFNFQESGARIPYSVVNVLVEPASRVAQAGIPYDVDGHPQGNFLNNYEVLNTCGRYENNKFMCVNETFVKTYAIPAQSQPRVFFDREFSIFSYNYCYSGFISEATRHRTDSIFVNRFNAPGDIWTSSRRSDPESLEKSVYNNLNFRNLSSRTALNVQWMVG